MGLDDNNNLPPFAECVDKMQAACDYLLAYAAQAHDSEASGEEGDLPVRHFLADLEFALLHVTAASRMHMATLQADVEALQALESFSDQLEDDAACALKVLRIVSTAPLISSRLVNNLNASVHLRSVLADLLVVDETIQAHQRAALVRPG